MTTGVSVVRRQAQLTLAGFAVLLAVTSCRPAPEPPKFYRFDDNLHEATAVRVLPVAKVDAASWFEFEEPEPLGWTVGTESSSCTVEEGALTFVTKRQDSIESPDNLRIDTRGANAHSILIRMRVTGAPTVDFQWRSLKMDYQHVAMFKIYPPRPGQWYTYEIDSSHLPHWRNRTISRLKFAIGRQGRVDIDFIRTLSRHAEFSQREVGVTLHCYARNNRTRACLYAHCPGEIEYRLRMPERAHISTGLGIINSGAPVKFSITAKQGASEKQLFTQEVNRNDRWHDAKIDMSEYANREIGIVFKTDCEDKRQVALWSNPILYEARAPRSEPYAREAESSLRPDDINVVVYLIDALRADHLDAYGYSRETGPTIRSLAQDGVRFARCFSQETWTKPSVASLFAGVPAAVHRTRRVGEMVPDSLVVLAEILRESGYATGAVLENGQAGGETNLGRGLSHLSHPRGRKYTTRTKEIAGFAEMHRDRPFFLYIHGMDVHAIHGKYSPPKGLRHLYASSGEEPTDMDLYDACILSADNKLQTLITILKELDVYDDTLLIITADHGEAFGEHEGITSHNGKPYNELIHIPLIVHLPGVLPAGKVIEQNVQLLDIAPTILDLLNLPIPDQFQGMTLLPLIRGEGTDAFRNRPVYSEWQGPAFITMSMIKDNWKLLRDEEVTRLYDLSTDFGETNDVAGQNESVVAALREELSDYLSSQESLAKSVRRDQADTTVRMDAEQIERLKALGYLK
jgi:arylsulfatase A-like enzyme